MKFRSLLFYPIKILSMRIIFFLFSKEKIGCINCNSKETHHFQKFSYYFLTLNIRFCKNCEVHQLFPILNKKGLGIYYKYLYRIDYLLVSKEVLFKREQRRGEYIANYLKEDNISLFNKNVFEVGAGCGGILDYLKTNFNCSVSGIDLDKETVKFANIKKVNLSFSDYINYNEKNKFDIIILSHVLEHIKDLKIFFAFIKNISHQKTLIYIEVPGIDNPRVKNRNYSIQPGHFYYFNEASLSSIVVKNNFKVKKINNIIQLIAHL